MTLKEIGPDGREAVYPDGSFLPRSQLAKAFSCSAQAIERVFTRAQIRVIETQGRTDMQRGMNVDNFPRLIDSMQRAQNPKQKLNSGRVDVSQDFRVTTVSGISFEYVHPPYRKR